jgi:3-hydroxybutyryl-CoA dehydrogenase
VSNPGLAVVVGSGTMGTGIAAVLAEAGWTVGLVDAEIERARSGRDRAMQLIRDRAARGKAPEEALTDLPSRLTAVADLSQVGQQPYLIIEAVPERLDLKIELLERASRLDPTLLATNTSSIPLRRMSGVLTDPRRFVGLHFFNPPLVMALVEVVRTEATSPETVEAATSLVRAIGKEPVVVRDVAGFATSRLGVLLGLEAIRMLEEGVADADGIDTAMRLGYRHPMGPLRLTDLVGLDVRLDIARTLERELGPRFAPPPLLERMVAEGRLGRKSGRGFYDWAG